MSEDKDKKKPAFGRGINALLSSIDTELQHNPKAVVAELANSIATLPVDQITPNPDQPRTDFDPQALQELAASIRAYGLIQPLTVRRLSSNEYQIISGERRWRASKIAGLTEVPAYVRVANDTEMLEMALVENIQREDLNAIEIALTYQRLLDEFKLTHDRLSDRVGKKRSTITNYTGLLKLPPEVQKGLKERTITMGHARCLTSLDDLALQISLYQEITARQLSVRDTEQLVARLKAPKSVPTETAPARLPREYQTIQQQLISHFGTKVALKRDKTGKGQIVLHFSNDEQLNRLLELLEP